MEALPTDGNIYLLLITAQKTESLQYDGQTGNINHRVVSTYI